MSEARIDRACESWLLFDGWSEPLLADELLPDVFDEVGRVEAAGVCAGAAGRLEVLARSFWVSSDDVCEPLALDPSPIGATRGATGSGAARFGSADSRLIASSVASAVSNLSADIALFRPDEKGAAPCVVSEPAAVTPAATTGAHVIAATTAKATAGNHHARCVCVGRYCKTRLPLGPECASTAAPPLSAWVETSVVRVSNPVVRLPWERTSPVDP